MPRWNRALAAERKARAVELAVQGLSYDRIAAEVGYANRGTAWKVVQKALKERTAVAVDMLRVIEVDRLNALQRALWDRAEAGDTRAGMAVLRIIDARCRVLGLYGPEPVTSGPPKSVVQTEMVASQG